MTSHNLLDDFTSSTLSVKHLLHKIDENDKQIFFATKLSFDKVYLDTDQISDYVSGPEDSNL